MFIVKCKVSFVRLFVVCALINLSLEGCITSPEKDGRADIILKGNGMELAGVAKAQKENIQYLAQNPGAEKTIQFADETGKEVVLAISFNNVSGEQFVKIRNLNNGKSIRIFWEQDLLMPTLKFLYDDGRMYQYRFFEGVSKPAQLDLNQLFVAGLGAAALGLAVWLGASVGKFILATIAFLAFNLLMLGIVVATGSFLVSFFNSMGWTSQTVLNFIDAIFNNVVEKIQIIIKNTVDILDRIFSKEAKGAASFILG